MNIGVTSAATPIVHLLDWHDFTHQIVTEDTHIIVSFSHDPTGDKLNINYSDLSYNFVLLVALIFAVPDIHFRLRAKILGLGLLILFSTHIFHLVVYILNLYGQRFLINGEWSYPFLYHRALNYIHITGLRIGGYIYPVIIWAGLVFYYKWSHGYLRATTSAK